MKKLICFDVDGTLVNNKSSWLTITVGLGCPVPEVLAVYGAVMSGKIPFSEGEAKARDIFLASGKATRDFITEIFRKETFRPGVFELVDHLKSKGYGIWLVSGAIDIYVSEIAKKIGANGFYAHSSIKFDNEGALAAINYSSNQSPWKAGVVAKLAQENGTTPDQIIFVGDDENDLEAFKLTGRGIAVEPFSEILRPAAWKTVKELSEIKKIL